MDVKLYVGKMEGRNEGTSSPRKELISREELKEKIDRRDDFKLVMALDDWHYKNRHIPSSISASAFLGRESLSDLGDMGKFAEAIRRIASELNSEDDIVIYCSHVACVGSVYVYDALKKAGFKNIRRYPGGVADWEDAGYPLEGEAVA